MERTRYYARDHRPWLNDKCWNYNCTEGNVTVCTHHCRKSIKGDNRITLVLPPFSLAVPVRAFDFVTSYVFLEHPSL